MSRKTVRDARSFPGYSHLLPFGTPVVKLDMKRHPVWMVEDGGSHNLHGQDGYL